MELYIGGTAQGKKVYVTQVRGIAEARIWDNFEEWFREKLQESAPKSPSPEAESMAYLEKHPDTVIICDEVGSGIVPLDSFEREYRERLGRLLCEIAAKAERVERIVCGIGQRMLMTGILAVRRINRFRRTADSSGRKEKSNVHRYAGHGICHMYL